MQFQFVNGGCGTCIGDTCRMCNTSYCNNRYPSSISCHFRFATLSPTYAGQGDVVPCLHGISTCYSYTHSITYAGCGTCSSNTHGSCVTCSTNQCNTHFPSGISCFYRANSYVGIPYTGTSAVSNGTLTTCSTGITSCYSYQMDQSLPYYYYDYSGCGVCNASAPLTRGCTTCTFNRCNYFVFNTGGTTTISTTTTNRINSGIITSTKSALASTISNIAMTTAMLQSVSVTSTSAQIYTTTASTATSTITNIAATTAAMNSATSKTTPTTTAISSFTSTMPGSSTRESPLKCFRNLGETKPNRQTNITCNLGSCFQFSFAHLYTDYYFAGCGNCSQFSTIFVNCLTCNHDYCNSAPVVLMLAVTLLEAACLLCCLVLVNINMQL